MLKIQKYLPVTLSVTECADFLKISKDHLRIIIRRGDIKGVYKINRRIIIPRDSLADYLYKRAYKNENKPYQTLGVIVD
jgi:excisionase family DNA binding protein|tara:strand:- start:7 stop:243 length:237 start_codon:yes stop_codon:yes gene_type:complete